MTSLSFSPGRRQTFTTPRSFRSWLLAFVAGVSLLGVPLPVDGQTTDLAVPGYVMKRWTTADGLPHNWISAIVQTRDGYLWLGTNNAGLARFDGVTFTTFNLLNTPALRSDAVTQLLEDNDGTLWIGTTAGLTRYHDGVFTTEPLDRLISEYPIVSLGTDPDGRVWAAGRREVIRRDGAGWTTVLSGIGVQRFWASSDRTIWIATLDGLIEWRDRVVRTYPARDLLPDWSVFAIHQDRRGRLWLGTARGLVTLDPNVDEPALAPVEPSNALVSALFEDGAGTLWMGGPDRVIARAPNGALSEAMLARDGRGLHTAVITEDRGGQIWLGVEGSTGGLYRLKRRRVEVLRELALPCDNIGAVTQGADDTIWIATFCPDGRGVFAVHDGTATHYRGPTFVASMLAEPDGALLVGTYEGELFRLAGRRFEAVDTPTQTPSRTSAIKALYRHADGSLWLGTAAHGVYVLRDGRWRHLQAADGLPGDEVSSLAGDPDGAVWIGLNGAVARYQNGQLTSFRVEDGVPPGAIRALHIDSDGTLWAGAYGGGLARLRNGAWNRFGTHGGVLDSSVHRIIDDGTGYFWLTGDRGIRRVSRHDLNNVAEGGTSFLNVTLLGVADGMLSAECNGMVQPAGWRMRDGTLHVPTQDGVARIDPATAIRTSPPDPIPHIEAAMVDGTPAAGPEIVAPAGYRDVEVRYTAAAMARPELVQFRYRLEGYSDHWVEAGTRRIASFVNLRPGRYRFVVEARSGSDWSASSAAAVLVLQPYFYQRRSVQVAFGVLGLVLAAGAGEWYRRRMRGRARQLEQAVAARTADLSIAHERLSAANDDLVRAKRDVDGAHSQLLAVFDQLDLGILVLSPTGAVRYASATAQQVLQKDASALIGQPWSACLPLVEADRAQVKARVERPSKRGRVPAQLVIGAVRYWVEVDVRDEPPPGDGRILYLYNVAEITGRPEAGGGNGPLGLVGRSTAMQIVYKQIRDVARVDSTVLIQGETGVGKEVVARAIHRESGRAAKPFIAVNAAGLTESLLASQLFGHRRGAFTGAVDDQVGVFEAASGGTVFLDEIGDMTPSVQASLLRVLQEREITRLGESQPRRVNVRFLAATHRDLAGEITAGRFREDLLYRIRVATIIVPPLRQRMDDVPPLVEAFVAEAVRHSGRAAPSVSRDAMDALLGYAWPGNVRELKAAIETALLNRDGDLVRREDLPSDVRGEVPELDGRSERDRILDSLRKAKGNRAEAARLLGIGRTTLYRRLSEYGLGEVEK